jgi:peptidoglycan-associated lipoprotein
MVSVLVLLVAGSLFAQSRLVARSNSDESIAAGGSGTVPSSTSLPPTRTEQREVQQNVKDIHFDFNRADLRPEDRSILQSDAEWLKAHPDVVVTIEGDADERGDIVYNVVLSEERADTTKDALVSMGVSADQIVYATGWGKLYPICTQADESCWRENRRAHFAAW